MFEFILMVYDTGAEAMFADLGHFNRRAIQVNNNQEFVKFLVLDTLLLIYIL